MALGRNSFLEAESNVSEEFFRVALLERNRIFMIYSDVCFGYYNYICSDIN